MEKRTATIYALVDPDTSVIRYIGKSINPKQRLCQHLRTVMRSPKDLWLRRLVAQKKRPRLMRLEIVSLENAEETERAWIAFGRKVNWPLLNASDGGEGCSNSVEFLK